MKKITHSHQIKLLRVVNILLSVMFIASIALISFIPEKKVIAQGGNPFGGLSTYIFYCTCSSGMAVSINDLTQPTGVTLPLLYLPGGTQLYPYGQIYSVGVWTLGLWQGGGSCQYFVGKGCATYSVEGTMIMVGTSM